MPFPRSHRGNKNGKTREDGGKDDRCPFQSGKEDGWAWADIDIGDFGAVGGGGVCGCGEDDTGGHWRLENTRRTGGLAGCGSPEGSWGISLGEPHSHCSRRIFSSLINRIGSGQSRAHPYPVPVGATAAAELLNQLCVNLEPAPSRDQLSAAFNRSQFSPAAQQDASASEQLFDGIIDQPADSSEVQQP